jgi:signal transduction histidine kinase
VPGEEFVAVHVSDTGPGVPPAEAERIFERLYQVPGSQESSRRGLGLGLYICRELVLAHGGQIWVDSQPGAGSTFTFTLPLAPARQGHAGVGLVPAQPGQA